MQVFTPIPGATTFLAACRFVVGTEMRHPMAEGM